MNRSIESIMNRFSKEGDILGTLNDYRTRDILIKELSKLFKFTIAKKEDFIETLQKEIFRLNERKDIKVLRYEPQGVSEEMMCNFLESCSRTCCNRKEIAIQLVSIINRELAKKDNTIKMYEEFCQCCESQDKKKLKAELTKKDEEIENLGQSLFNEEIASNTLAKEHVKKNEEISKLKEKNSNIKCHHVSNGYAGKLLAKNKQLKEELAKKVENKGIIIYCDVCGKLLLEPGALRFGVPVDGLAKKRHVCVACVLEGK